MVLGFFGDLWETTGE